MSGTENSPAHVDLRGFSYPLAPYALQQQWQMEKLQTQLKKAKIAVNEAQHKYDCMDLLLQTQSEHMQQSLQTYPHPAAYQQGLAYLAQLQHQMLLQKELVNDLKVECARLRTENIAQQRTLDGLKEHKAQSQHVYAAEVVRNEAAEADRNWIGREHHRIERQPGSNEVSPWL